MALRRLRQAMFAALYDRLATHYDRISRLGFAGEWARWQAVALRYADRPPVVELGCGTGQALAGLRRQGVSAFGVDQATPMLSQARRRVAGALIRADARYLPLRTTSVGTLLSIFPTPYIFDPATWAEAGRVLRPGGRLVIVDHGWLTADDPLRGGLWLAHRLIYGWAPSAPPDWPAALPPVLSLVERTAHGYVSLRIATWGGDEWRPPAGD